MSRANPPHCQDALQWLKHRGWKLGSLTGQDYVVLVAISHCWQLWTRGDAAGQRAAIEAAASLLAACQETVWPMARELIAHAGDWGHRDVVWPKVVEQFEEIIYGHHIQECMIKKVDWAQNCEARAFRLANCHQGRPEVEARHG